jgi:hypothetical protein
VQHGTVRRVHFTLWLSTVLTIQVIYTANVGIGSPPTSCQ